MLVVMEFCYTDFLVEIIAGVFCSFIYLFIPSRHCFVDVVMMVKFQ